MGDGPLISAAALAALLDAPPEERPTVLDVRWRLGGPLGHEEFVRGHLPGAAYVDLDADLAGRDGEGRHPLPDPADFQAAMRAAGVDHDRLVVVYDDWSGHAAARCWWLLRHHGHERVRVLDGAWSAWRQGGGRVETGPSRPRSGTFTARPGTTPVVHSDSICGADVVVDARAWERYTGESEPVDPVAGRIPGAVNVPTSANLQADGRFRRPAELASLYAAVGAVPGADVAVYCGSGVTAAHDVLAMEVAGVTAALYPESWSGWITDPERPVERD